jgi:hypothetical protein
MATQLTKLPKETSVIDPEDHKLLHRALTDWYNLTEFTDNDVAQVKQTFQRWLVETAWSKQHDKLCVVCVQSDPPVLV